MQSTVFLQCFLSIGRFLDASISVFIRNVSKEVFYIELIDAYTVSLEGYLYQADREIPFELLNQLLIENN